MILTEDEIDKQLEEYEQYKKEKNSFIKIKNNEIEKLEELSHYCALKNIDRKDNKFGEFVVAIQKVKKYIQQLEKEKQENYWQGYIKKQNESVEICKICKYRDKYRQLEAELSKANNTINQYKEREQKLIKYLEEKIKLVNSGAILSTRSELKEIREKMLKGEKK